MLVPSTVLNVMRFGNSSVQLSERKPPLAHRIYLFGGATRKHNSTKYVNVLGFCKIPVVSPVVEKDPCRWRAGWVLWNVSQSLPNSARRGEGQYSCLLKNC